MNKRVALMLIGILVLSIPVTAQNIWPGNFMVGGDLTGELSSISRERSPEEQDPTTTEGVSAQLGLYGGYFIRQGLEIGPSIMIEYSDKSTDGPAGSSESTELGANIGAHIGYYHFLDMRWVPFGKLTVTFNHDESEDETADYYADGIGLVTQAGAEYFITGSIALKLAAYLDYELLWWDRDTGSTSLSGSTDTYDLGITAGVDLFFSRD